MHWFIRDERKVNSRNTASKHRADFIADRQEAAVESLVSAKRAKVLTSAKSNLGAWRIGTKPVNRPTGTVNLLENQPSMEASLQKLSQSDIRCSNNAQLEMAIADFFHCMVFPSIWPGLKGLLVSFIVLVLLETISKSHTETR